ncbi:GDP-L-fucose synthase family protein [Sulfurovum riftiae]|uniref:GDP-L-fucose synthase n=1 Tax=Sulfurovum riftiae TaxID=1630136 RepID=A0A151CIA1_9BACT|nr:GDP-L-fucose synthase [Sulfurovum riftiae]KYJ86983.1 GDP-fucose synthetase [Sulfurovum riftiae]
MKKESTIFVAGGTGLVGSAIIKSLLAKGYTNVISNYHHREPKNTAIRYYPLDLTNQQNVEYFFETFKPEYVFLAAAKVGGIIANNVYRAEFIYSNLVIQNNVIDISYRYGVKKLLFLGSTCIYPKECPQPMKEEYLLTGPLEYTNEPYAIAKIAGIKMCESYNLQYGTNFISVMPTNLYGPNDNFDLEKSHVLPALIRKIHCAKLLNEAKYDEVIQDLGVSTLEEAKAYLANFGVDENRVEIWGSGKPMREFLWSEDMADACVFLMENRDFKDTYTTQDGANTTCSPNEVRHEEIRNTHINIGTGVDISIKELAETIKEIVGFKGELYFNTDKPDGTMKKLTDPSKLHSLGWKHKVELNEGIEKMYAWYKESN